MKAMPARRLEDRIRELCAKAVYEKGPQWRATIRELQASIQEHTLRLSNATAAVTVIGKPEVMRERRNSRAVMLVSPVVSLSYRPVAIFLL